MNFKNKIFASMLAASMATGLIAGMAAPVYAEPVDVPVVVNGLKDRTLAAYQIFSGTLKDDGKELGNIEWGKGINKEAFLDALSKKFDGFDKQMSAAQVAEKLAKFNAAQQQEFAKIALANTTNTFTQFSSSDKFVSIEPGYYLIADKTNLQGADEAVNPALLQISDKLVINFKTGKPEVDKQVEDETADMEEGADSEGFGESADHAIGEPFKFKLIGTIPANTQVSQYVDYLVTFNDSYDAGVTYLGGEKVVVTAGDNNEGIELNNQQFTVDSDPANRTLKINISDLKKILPAEDLDKQIVITVTYNAMLNENAKVVTPTESGAESNKSNNNKVSLSYTNNPNVATQGNMGQTQEDTVFVFTYEVPNKKVDQDNNPLQGVEFELYSDEACTKDHLIKLTAVTNANNEVFYRPVTGNETAAALTSDANGLFNIKGVDAGTYYLKETKTPAGYNSLKKPVKIEITDVHKENAGGTEAVTAPVLKVENQATSMNKIVNHKGMVMPETGGMGTVAIYTTGAALIVGAGVLLVARKKAEHEGK